MKTEITTIGSIDAIILGDRSKKVFLFVHGQGGNKEEAIPFAEIAVPKGYQVIGIDLPVMDQPWEVLAMLNEVKEYLYKYYDSVSIRANSIGAWFSLLSFQDRVIVQALFVSPILNMRVFIEGMQEKDEAYYDWVIKHPIEQWTADTFVLRPKIDIVVNDKVYDSFLSKFESQVHEVENGEHWFHTPEQLLAMQQWEKSVIR